MDDQLAPRPLSEFERFVAHVTLTDPDLLIRCHLARRQEMIHDFVALCVMATLFTVVWTATITAGGIAWWQALPIAMLISSVILLLDIRLAASDSEPRGILRNGPLSISYYWRIGARLCVAILLNSTTALGLDMFIMRDEALKVMARQVDAQNEPIRQEYATKIDALRVTEVRPVEERLAGLITHADDIGREQRDADTTLATTLSAAQAADLEAERQDHGFGTRNAGHGVLAIDAEKQRDLARQQMDATRAHKTELVNEAARVQDQVGTANDELAAARGRFEAGREALLRERDGRLLRPSIGPLTVVLGWLNLERNPDYGGAVQFTTFVIWLTMSILELAFFLMRIIFKDAQIYDTRKNTRTLTDAVAIGADYAAFVRETRRRSPLRVVAANEAAPDEPAQQARQQANEGR